ncbi:MAG: IS630 transposase-related protein, partial [Rickettsia endosymbiont of Ixodes persulcatus]|nr:IS630 transposase-related protein [Rickettsia endosymbiont of Ixodes persulcatus]
DLRMKLFKALDDVLSIVKACKIFNIGRNTIYRWKTLKWETGDIKAKQWNWIPKILLESQISNNDVSTISDMLNYWLNYDNDVEILG